MDSNTNFVKIKDFDVSCLHRLTKQLSAPVGRDVIQNINQQLTYSSTINAWTIKTCEITRDR
jgi:hypothetical protein